MQSYSHGSIQVFNRELQLEKEYYRSGFNTLVGVLSDGREAHFLGYDEGIGIYEIVPTGAQEAVTDYEAQLNLTLSLPGEMWYAHAGTPVVCDNPAADIMVVLRKLYEERIGENIFHGKLVFYNFTNGLWISIYAHYSMIVVIILS